MGSFYPEGQRGWRPLRAEDESRALAHRLTEVTSTFKADHALSTARSMGGLTLARDTLTDPVGFADATAELYVQSLINALRNSRVLFSP